jgi:hypothetical protein
MAIEKETLRDWHRLFGLLLTDFFTGSPFVVEVERDLSVQQQLLDVVIVRRGRFAGRLPDGQKKTEKEARPRSDIHQTVAHVPGARKQQRTWRPDPVAWKNPSLDRFLGALAAYLRDVPGLPRSRRIGDRHGPPERGPIRADSGRGAGVQIRAGRTSRWCDSWHLVDL